MAGHRLCQAHALHAQAKINTEYRGSQLRGCAIHKPCLDGYLPHVHYKAKKNEYAKAKTAESVAKKQVSLTQLDTASTPNVDEPVRPILWINTAVSAVVALLLAVGYAFIADYYDHRFKTVEQIEDYLDLPVLGSVQNLGRGIIVRK